jgi:maltose-binding protein MalE
VLQQVLTTIATDLSVNLSIVPLDADGIRVGASAAQLTDQPLPGIFLGDQDDLGVLQRAGLLQPASDSIDAELFVPALVEGATLSGERWGTPIVAQGFLLLLYNRKLTNQVPRTSDDLIVQSRARLANDQFGLVSAWAEPRWFAAWLTGMGGWLTDQADKPTLNTPEMANTLNLLRELRASGPPPPSSYRDGERLFRTGKTAYAIDGDWSFTRFRNLTDTLELGVTRMPTIPATGRIASPPLSGLYLMYNQNLSEQHLSAARSLSVALLEQTIQVRLARELEALPALQTALSDPALADNPVLAAAAAQVKGARGLPATIGLRCVWRSINAALPGFLTEEFTREATLERMQRDAEACIRQ